MNIRNGIRTAYDSRVEALLEQLGLEHKRSTLEIVGSAISLFGAGIALGAALGVAFAPKRGEELRDDVRHRLGDLKDRSAQRYDDLLHRGEALLGGDSGEVAQPHA